jgi:hypothetical protein
MPRVLWPHLGYPRELGAMVEAQAGLWALKEKASPDGASDGALDRLAVLGAFGGHLGGAPIGRAALRVTLGGALAMAVTALIGHLLGISVG